MKRSKLLTSLWEFQQSDGYISDKAIAEISQKLKVSKIEIEGVVTFYHFFHRQPTGKYIIYLNNSIISEHKGFSTIKASFEKETNCTCGQTNYNGMFSIFETACIGLSDQEPAALINFFPFTNLTPAKVKLIIEQLKSGADLKAISDKYSSKIQFTPPEDKTVFFRAYNIGAAIKKLKDTSPQEVLNNLKNIKLAGRGGAFFPTALKWEHSQKSPHKTKYIICNADEGEPGTFKDKALLNNLPGLALEGMITAAFVTGAQKGYIYLRAEYSYLIPIIEATIHKFYQNGYLGKNCCGIESFNFDIDIQLGAGAYVCGAESALIESIEGKRGIPRIRKYFPTEYGLFGRSTIVNNVETLVMAARIIELEPAFFKNIGTNKSKGTKLLSVSGDVAKPGIYEIEWGISVNEILHKSQATSPYYIQLSGPSGECINKSEFERQICKEDLLCGGSIMVFSKSRSIIQILENFITFFKTESCGNCTPCRAGTQILHEKIKKLKKGLCTKKDLEDVKQWGQIMRLTSKCGLGQYAAQTFAMAIEKFPEYFNLKIIDESDNKFVEFDMETAVFDYDLLIKNSQ